MHDLATRRFLLAAKQAEIDSLQQLARNCELVRSLRELIHALQRERGSSNVFLCGHGEHFVTQRQQCEAITDGCLDALQAQLSQLLPSGQVLAGSMRLLNAVASALLALDSLADLRERVRDQKISAPEATEAFSELIARLLGVIFEAADIACDPLLSRTLVSLFNFMQGKEFAGQERAWGAIGVAGEFSIEALAERLLQLQQAQQHSMDVFMRYAEPALATQWQALDASASSSNMQRLRAMVAGLQTEGGGSLALSEVWYEVATERIDAMQAIEEDLISLLLLHANEQLEQAQAALKDHAILLSSLHAPQPGQTVGSHPLVSTTADAGGVRSLNDLLCEQDRYIRTMSQELDEARRAISEQKVIDRARLVLMQQYRLSESEAFRRLQKSAMDQNCRLADVAQRVVNAISQPG